jgi:branched-chain amino acid transport system ATP-binding protein
MFLTFPVMVIRVNPIENIVEWRWWNMLGLAPKIVRQIFEIIRKVNTEQKMTIFLVEQNANLALQVANRGYVMENGKIVIEDSADNLLSNEEVKKAYLGI